MLMMMMLTLMMTTMPKTADEMPHVLTFGQVQWVVNTMLWVALIAAILRLTGAVVRSIGGRRELRMLDAPHRDTLPPKA